MINTFLTALIKRIASTIKTICQNDHLILLVLLALDHLNWSPLQHRRQRASSMHALQTSHPRSREWLFQLTFSTRPLYFAHVGPTPRHLFPAGIMRFVQIQFLAENNYWLEQLTRAEIITRPVEQEALDIVFIIFTSPRALIYLFLFICKFISLFCFYNTCGPSW